MILLTGGTGVVGSALLPKLLDEGHEVRCLVRDPRRLGSERVRVHLSLADLGDPRGLRHAVRGADTVIHLAAAIRDQPPRRVEEITGLGTHRLLRAAEEAGVKRFIFFSALGANSFQRTRFFRSKALAEQRVAESEIPTTILAPSIIYDPGDDWVKLMRRLALLPVLPISGSGQAAYEPIWAQDAAQAVLGALEAESGRYELAGPDRLTYEQIARLIAAAAGRERPSLHVPLPFVRSSLLWLRRIFGESAFATWEEAELMEVPMISERGTADVRRLGVDPRPMRAVLGAT
ncbi:MAG: NAD(P)H-binding protein [Solirubrobacterales bacterium]|nr:NAD(P)H-binding protein [Solirubrobacterales bacterium]